MGNEVCKLYDRHFGPESDFSKKFVQPKLMESGVNRQQSSSNNLFGNGSSASEITDERLYTQTRAAMAAGVASTSSSSSTAEHPKAHWSKEQTQAWWNTELATMRKLQEQWSGSIPPGIPESLTVLDRQIQGIPAQIIKVKNLLDAPTVVYFPDGGGFGATTNSSDKKSSSQPLPSYQEMAYQNYLYRLAALGQCVVVAVDPAAAASSLNPSKNNNNNTTKNNASSFTALVNSCALAVQALSTGDVPRVKKGPVVLAGNSTGGTLALATAVKAKKEGWVDKIAGIYTICPLVEATLSGSKYPSMKEFNNYYISEGYFQACINMIKDDVNYKKLLPMNASKEDLAGLPPTKIIVHQLDMLRDTGIAMHFKLMKAGVAATFNIISGAVHDQQLFTTHSPEVTQASIYDLTQFSKHVLSLTGMTFPITTPATSSATDPVVKAKDTTSSTEDDSKSVKSTGTRSSLLRRNKSKKMSKSSASVTNAKSRATTKTK